MNLNLTANSNPVPHVEGTPHCTKERSHFSQLFVNRHCVICAKLSVQNLFPAEIDENLPAKVITTEESLLQILDISEDVYWSLPRDKYRPDYWAFLCDKCTEWVDAYFEVKIENAEQGEVLKTNMKLLIQSTIELNEKFQLPTWGILEKHVFADPFAVKHVAKSVEESILALGS